MGNTDTEDGDRSADATAPRAPVSTRVLTFKDDAHGAGLNVIHVIAAAFIVMGLWFGARVMPEIIPPFGALFGGIAWLAGLFLLCRGAFRHRALSLPGAVAILAGDVMVSTDSWSTVSLAAVVIAALWLDRRDG